MTTTTDDLDAAIDALEDTGEPAAIKEARRLRKEVAQYREAKEAAEAKAEKYAPFDGLPDQDVQALAQFAGSLNSPADAARMAAGFARQLSDVAGVDYSEIAGLEPAADEPAEPVVEEADMTGLSDDQIKALVAEQVKAALDEQAQRDAQQKAILREVKDLGFEPDFDNEQTFALLSLATKYDGDLKAAAEAFSKITGKSTSDEGTLSTAPDGDVTQPDGTDVSPPPTPDGVPAQGKTQPTTMSEASAAALARLDAAGD